MRGPKALVTLVSFVVLAAPTAATAATGGVAPPSRGSAPAGPTGGSQYDPNAPKPPPTTPGPPTPPGVARLIRGVAYAPAGAPTAVARAIRAGNKLQDKPYRYGGGHASFRDTAYDCSGSVSFALHGAGLLKAPLDSTGFMTWLRHGRGKWITVYANAGHAYMVIAGLRLDTS